MLRVCPLSLKQANAHVAKFHRHHRPTVGHKFSIGCLDGDRLCAVSIVGRPVARGLDNGFTFEILRLCTDGTKHAASKLIAASTRASFSMGATMIVSYILEDEDGTSYRAAGWSKGPQSGGGHGMVRLDRGLNQWRKCWALKANIQPEKRLGGSVL